MWDPWVDSGVDHELAGCQSWGLCSTMPSLVGGLWLVVSPRGPVLFNLLIHDLLWYYYFSLFLFLWLDTKCLVVTANPQSSLSYHCFTLLSLLLSCKTKLHSQMNLLKGRKNMEASQFKWSTFTHCNTFLRNCSATAWKTAKAPPPSPIWYVTYMKKLIHLK